MAHRLKRHTVWLSLPALCTRATLHFWSGQGMIQPQPWNHTSSCEQQQWVLFWGAGAGGRSEVRLSQNKQQCRQLTAVCRAP